MMLKYDMLVAWLTGDIFLQLIFSVIITPNMFDWRIWKSCKKQGKDATIQKLTDGISP
jgi:hypothetical protein